MLPFFSKLPPCLIGVEACAKAQHWAGVLVAMGHDVRIMPPSYVKSNVKRGKSDAIDAEAFCEAVQRPTMRFVPVKSIEQPSILMSHRARSLLVRQLTIAATALRAHLAEFGEVTNPGIVNLAKLADKAFAEAAPPSYAHRALEILIGRISKLTAEIRALDQELKAWHAENQASRSLAAIPGIRVTTATALAATVTDPDQFRSARQFAAWLVLTPQQSSTGRKTRLGGISKQGDRYLRRLPVVCATAAMRHARRNTTPMTDWVNSFLEKQSVPPRLCRSRQQARPHRMGGAHMRRNVQTRRSASLTAGDPDRIGKGSR